MKVKKGSIWQYKDGAKGQIRVTVILPEHEYPDFTLLRYSNSHTGTSQQMRQCDFLKIFEPGGLDRVLEIIKNVPSYTYPEIEV